MNNISTERLFDYHKHNLVYIGDYIKFADQKAGVAITLNIALIGFFFNYIRKANFEEHIVAKVFLIIGIVTLVLSILCFLFKVLWPRYNEDPNQYMSWGGIASFPDAQNYAASFSSRNEEDFIKDMAEQNYFLADVCLKKYKFLRLGFILFSLGTVLATFSWIFDK